MDINLENPTAEQIEALKKAIPGLTDKLGVLVLNPAEPLSREQMEKLTIEHKIDGEQVKFSVWDGAQAKSLATSAAKDKREASDLRKRLEQMEANEKAFETFRAAADKGEVPPAEVIALVAKTIGVEPDDVVAGLQSSSDGGNGDGKDKAKGKPAAGDRKIKWEDLDPTVQKRFLSEVHSDFLSEQMSKDAEGALAKHITDTLAKHPAVVKFRKDTENDPNKKAILDNLEKLATRAVNKESRGRIAQMQTAGTGDILAEMPGIVDGVVKELDFDSILAKAAPQPILLGAGEPGQTPLTVLSNEKVDDSLRLNDPNWKNNEVKGIMLDLAKAGATAQ